MHVYCERHMFDHVDPQLHNNSRSHGKRKIPGAKWKQTKSDKRTKINITYIIEFDHKNGGGGGGFHYNIIYRLMILLSRSRHRFLQSTGLFSLMG